jgi:hypothetical protein
VPFGVAFDQAGGHKTSELATGGAGARQGAALDLAQVKALLGFGHEEGQDAASNGRSADGQASHGTVLKQENDRSQT